MKFFKPDFEFKHYTDISMEWLTARNIKTIFSDLDSTLAAHGHVGDEEFENWYGKLKAHGITLVVVSNNSQSRVDRFTNSYQIKGFGMCKKPSTSVIKSIMKKVNAHEETSIFLGDQLLTDVWCGKQLKMKTVLVHPLGQEHEPWNISLKRKLEKLIRTRW